MTAAPPAPPRAPGSIARWGFFVVALVLGTALLVSSVTSYLGAETLLTTVIRGQAQSLRRSLFETLPPRREHGPPRADELDAFVRANAEDGIRYVVIVDPRGDVVVEAGEGSSLPPIEPDQIRVRGSLVQAAFPMPPPGPQGPPPGPPGGWGPEGERPPPLRPGDRRPIVVIEFVPEAALALRARTRRDLGVGLAVALALLLGAGVFWRLSRRAQLAEARLAAQRHLAALGEMSAVLAHEIRNPLASLKGHAQLLAERVEDDAPLRRKAGRILDETQRLERLTNGLLDFARTSRLERTEVDPVALVRRCAEACQGEVEVEIMGPEVPDRAWLDGPKIEQVLSNLLSNAHQAAPESAVLVGVGRAQGVLSIEVRDRGPGVPLEQRERIFEPFHTTRTRGTGLGLAISRRIVEQHGGRIEIFDSPPGGGCFRVVLPATSSSS